MMFGPKTYIKGGQTVELVIMISESEIQESFIVQSSMFWVDAQWFPIKVAL